MKTTDKWIILVTALAMSAVAQANGQTLVTERSISVNAALDMASAGSGSMPQARQRCDHHGAGRADRTVVIVRDDGASPHSVEHCLRKAHTGAYHDMPSSEYGKRAAAGSGSAGPLHLANITTAGVGCR